MNYLYKHKHKKPHPTTIQLKRWSNLFLQKIKLFDTLVEIDLKILWCDMRIAKYTIEEYLAKAVDFHDEWWDKVDFKLEDYTHDTRVYCEKELTHWKRYFRSLHNGLD